MLIRRLREKRCQVLYEDRGIVGDPCIYCGVPSSCMDHVPPLHYVERLSETDRELIEGRLLLLPACSECNGFLGGLILTTLRERRAYVRERLMRKYRHYVNMPEWDDQELDELGRQLNDNVRIGQNIARLIKARLAYWR